MADNRKPAPLMTPNEVADLLQLARKTVVRMARDGRIPCVRIGRVLRFDHEEIDRWLRDQRR